MNEAYGLQLLIKKADILGKIENDSAVFCFVETDRTKKYNKNKRSDGF